LVQNSIWSLKRQIPDVTKVSAVPAEGELNYGGRQRRFEKPLGGIAKLLTWLLKLWFISGGLNIYPKEIETIIDAQPGVYESAVIGLPDPDFGERVIAMIVEVPGHTLDQRVLSKALAQSLAKFKLPKQIITVNSLPRNAM